MLLTFSNLSSVSQLPNNSSLESQYIGDDQNKDSKGLKKIEEVSYKWIYFLVRERRIQNSCPSSTTTTSATTIEKIARTFGP